MGFIRFLSINLSLPARDDCKTRTTLAVADVDVKAWIGYKKKILLKLIEENRTNQYRARTNFRM